MSEFDVRSQEGMLESGYLRFSLRQNEGGTYETFPQDPKEGGEGGGGGRGGGEEEGGGGGGGEGAEQITLDDVKRLGGFESSESTATITHLKWKAEDFGDRLDLLASKFKKSPPSNKGVFQDNHRVWLIKIAILFFHLEAKKTLPKSRERHVYSKLLSCNPKP